MEVIINKIISSISNDEASEYANKMLVLENCIIGSLDLTSIVFESHVTIRHCIINEFKVHSTWFSGGLEFRDNIVLSDIIYEMGGHNNQSIEITHNIFHGFFCFFDCQFDALLMVKKNIFVRGSDIFYKEHKGFDNVFANGYIVEDNIGVLDSIENCPPL